MKGLAKLAYAAYGAVTGNKNFRGDPMPEWDDLGEAIRSAWTAAAGAVRTEVLSIRQGDFADALDTLRQGGQVWREGWNGKGMWLMLQRPDEHSKMSREYIYMSTVDGDLVPWVASQTDLLAHDWVGTGNFGDS